MLYALARLNGWLSMNSYWNTIKISKYREKKTFRWQHYQENKNKNNDQILSRHFKVKKYCKFIEVIHMVENI